MRGYAPYVCAIVLPSICHLNSFSTAFTTKNCVETNTLGVAEMSPFEWVWHHNAVFPLPTRPRKPGR
jgi:hypothetical protein